MMKLSSAALLLLAGQAFASTTFEEEEEEDVYTPIDVPIILPNLEEAWRNATGLPSTYACLHKRFVIDNLLTWEQCDALAELGEIHAEKDPVVSNMHGSYIFKIAQDPSIEVDWLRLMNNTRTAVHEIVSHYLGKSPETNASHPYMNPQWQSDPGLAQKQMSDLYFHFSHLTQRGITEHEDEPGLAHLYHADQCMFDPSTKACSFIEHWCCDWRSHSAILYLNDVGSSLDDGDFVGGQLVFNKSPECGDHTVEIRPRCGRLVAFTSGPENYHAVRSVSAGTRKAFAFWFTRDISKKEIFYEGSFSREEAERLRRINAPPLTT